MTKKRYDRKPLTFENVQLLVPNLREKPGETKKQVIYYLEGKDKTWFNLLACVRELGISHLFKGTHG